MSNGIAAGLLLSALATFWISARQWPIWVRLLKLVVGWVLLIAAGREIWALEGEAGYLRLLADLVQNWSDPGQSVIGQAFSHNAGAADRFIPPLLSLGLIAAVALGVVATLALTPGERLEQMVRPALMLLKGALAGAAITLALVTLGFGAARKPTHYASTIKRTDIHDGDTLRVGDVSLRLFGIDAPELNQVCQDGKRKCGDEARESLVELIEERTVICTRPKKAEKGRKLTESFGRPLVSCRALANDGEAEIPDVAMVMLAQGFAVAYGGADELDFQDYHAAEAHAGGLMDACFLHPKLARASQAGREKALQKVGDGRAWIGRACNGPA